MNDTVANHEDGVYLEFTQNAKTVYINITYEHDLSELSGDEYIGGWQLVVDSGKGLRSHWTDYFTSPRLAVDAAFQAIEEEGIDAFIESEDCAYLKEIKA